MSGYHTVKQGECLSSIAKQYGFSDYKVIYDHPENATLREDRDNPNIICPGDSLYIPDKEKRIEDRGTDARHDFVLEKPKTMLRVIVTDEDGQPCPSAQYQLLLGAESISNATGPDGLIEHLVPADLEKAILDVWIKNGDAETITQRWSLNIGHLDPVDEPSGIQARLNNLGYHCGEVDGVIGPKTKAAVRQFQEDQGLAVDGIAGPRTQAKLKSVHGC